MTKSPAETHTPCPALFLAGVASRQGKTTLTAGLARYHRQAGRTVRVFKIGPDFLDPMILEQASSHPVYQLDLWMVGEERCRQQLYEAACQADLILVEGAMGLFDGTPSGADLAERFGIPVVVVIDATAMAQTFGAVAFGLKHYRPTLPFAGVVANQVASERHADMLSESLPADIPLLATLLRDEKVTLPERHLGLVQASEVSTLDDRLNAAAARLQGTGLVALPPPVSFHAAAEEPPQPHLSGLRIGVAQDAAFGFIYPANLQWLRQMGAEVCLFSPLADEKLPEIDALWLPGGYPELHLNRLEENQSMAAAIRGHHQADKPILAECGGMLYLLERLTDKEGKSGQMVGLLPGSATLQSGVANLGLHRIALPDGEMRGHTFHHSQMVTDLEPVDHSRPLRAKGRPEPLYQVGKVTASYLHLYFPSGSAAAARLFLQKK